MTLYLQNWYNKFLEEMPKTTNLRIISPFVKEQILRNIQSEIDFKNFELITRFSLRDFGSNVSSLQGLKFAAQWGASIFGIQRLHSKIYLFDKRAAIITSANFTSGGMFSNYECGIYLTDAKVVNDLHNYFEDLKVIGGDPLTVDQCDTWQAELDNYKEVVNTIIPSLPDYGRSHEVIDDQRNYYIKFFGKGDNRVSLNFMVREEIDRALCHYACCFSRAPRQFQTGDIIYFARMLAPSDYAIFGKAEAIAHVPSRDEASQAEIDERDWKEDWPLYLRVSNPVFIDGVMGDCVMLHDLIRHLDYQSFPTCRLRYQNGQRDINPFRSLSRQPGISLTLEAVNWLEPRFSQVLRRKGRVDDNFISGLPTSGY